MKRKKYEGNLVVFDKTGKRSGQVKRSIEDDLQPSPPLFQQIVVSYNGYPFRGIKLFKIKTLANDYGINTTGAALLRTSVLFPYKYNLFFKSLNRAVPIK